NGWPQSAIALSGGVQGGNNAVIDAVLARSKRYGAPARGITLNVSCQRNATKASADDSSPEKDKHGKTGKPVRRRKMKARKTGRKGVRGTTIKVKENYRIEARKKRNAGRSFIREE
ncbi:hypothetical protein K0M31_016967, partial [Melipona bicolor]